MQHIFQKFDLKITGVAHAGAHVGQEVEMYVNYGIKDIFLFEPQKETFQNLLRSMLKFQKQGINVQCFNHALGPTKKTTSLHRSSNNGGSSSLLAPKDHITIYPEVQFTDSEEVQVERLDDIALPKVNFLVMDVQGYELEVLKGATSRLSHIDYIYTEVNQLQLYEGGVLIDELDAFLSKFNFKRVDTAWLGGVWGDALYIKSS